MARGDYLQCHLGLQEEITFRVVHKLGSQIFCDGWSSGTTFGIVSFPGPCPATVERVLIVHALKHHGE